MPVRRIMQGIVYSAPAQSVVVFFQNLRADNYLE